MNVNNPNNLTFKVKLLHPNAKIPTMAHPGSDAGWDLCTVEDFTIPARGCILVKTGISIELPILKSKPTHNGSSTFPMLPDTLPFWAEIASRSGIGAKRNVVAFPGIIDNAYLGEIGVKLFSHSDQPQSFKVGDRIAQLVTYPWTIYKLVIVDELNTSSRGEKGWGSSGLQ